MTSALLTRLKSIQAKVVSRGSKRPTYSSIIETQEACSDKSLVVEILTQIWKQPNHEAIRDSILRIKKTKAKSNKAE